MFQGSENLQTVTGNIRGPGTFREGLVKRVKFEPGLEGFN